MNQPSRTGHRNARYDAFVSYSHAADAGLARALQQTLQRFATPWNPLRRVNPSRSLRIFRDQSSLSADPGLWPAIEKALLASDWFVLLASREAANSEWIGREVSFWCENKRNDRMLLILTGGELCWDHATGHFDLDRSSAIPRRLSGVFANEPLWLDLRWTKSGPRIDPRDPRFRDAVASIAAPIRGVAKDELIGEDIRQHRRLGRWRNAALVTLSILLLGTLAAAQLALHQRGLALEREAEANAERTRATRQAEIALARQLAAQSVQLRLQSVGKIETSLLLAIEAVRRDPSIETTQALMQALALTPRRLKRFYHRWGDFQPYAMVLGIAYSPDGLRLASTNEDGSVALWEIDGDKLWQQEVSSERLRPVAFRPNGKQLAVGGEEGRVFLLDVENGEQLDVFEHGGPVRALAFDTSGRFLASASEDGTARIVDVDTGSEIGRLSFGAGDLADVRDVEFSPDGRLLAAINEGGRICLWNVAERSAGDCLPTKGHGLYLAFSNDGTMIAAASENFASVWDVATGKFLNRFEHVDLLGNAKMAHFIWLNGLAFSPDGRFLATAGRDGTARVWSLWNGQEALRFQHTGPVATLDFSPDGGRLATATDLGTARVWELPSGRELFRIGNSTGSTIQALSFSRDGRQIVTGDWSSEIDVWSMSSAIEGARLHHGDDLKNLAFSPDGRFIATITDDHLIHLWATEGWSEVASIRRFAPKQLRFADDGNHLLVESQAGGLEVMSVSRSLDPVQLVERTSGDTVLMPQFAVYETGGKFFVWRADSADRIALGIGRGLPVDAYALNDSAALIAVAYEGGNAIEIWDLIDGKSISRISFQSRVRRMAFDPDGDRLAVVYGERAEGAGRYDPLDYRVEIRELAADQVLARVEIGRQEPRYIFFMPNGRHLIVVTGRSESTDEARVLDLAGRNALYALEDVGEIRTARAAPDGHHLAISDRRRVRIWDITTGKAVIELPTSGYIGTIGFTPDGRYLATGSNNDDLTLWPWHVDELLGRACRHATRNLTPKEWRDFLPDIPYRPTCANLSKDEGKT